MGYIRDKAAEAESMDRFIAKLNEQFAEGFERAIKAQGEAYREEGMIHFRWYHKQRAGESNLAYFERLLRIKIGMLKYQLADAAKAAWELAPILGALRVERGEL